MKSIIFRLTFGLFLDYKTNIRTSFGNNPNRQMKLLSKFC